MDLEEVLARVAELSREELHIVRKRAEEKTAARGKIRFHVYCAALGLRSLA